MQKEKSLLFRHRMYFITLVIITMTSLLFLAIQGKEASFVSLTSFHPAYLDAFFVNYTFFGDGIFALIIIAILFFYFKRKQQALALLYAFLISGIGAQILKNLIRWPRPRIHFEPGTYLHFIDGVTLSGSSGFPSGHTATAFAMATVVVLILKNKKWQLPVLLATLLVGYSRIYLAHHFLIDVIAGAVLGTASGIVAFYLAQKKLRIKGSIKKMHQVPSEPATSPNSAQTT